jgi:chromosome segregation ATPase
MPGVVAYSCASRTPRREHPLQHCLVTPVLQWQSGGGGGGTRRNLRAEGVHAELQALREEIASLRNKLSRAEERAETASADATEHAARAAEITRWRAAAAGLGDSAEGNENTPEVAALEIAELQSACADRAGELSLKVSRRY